MLEAIYAWRRNGGMRWPRYERSDAIMDLRAASRTSNSFNIALLIPPQLRTIALTSGSLTPQGTQRTAATPPVCRVTPPPKPGSHFIPPLHLVSTEAPVKSITVCAKEASAVSIIWSDALCNVRPSQLGGKMPLSCMHCLSLLPGVNRNSSCPFPKAPNGVLLTTGSVAQSPVKPCPRLTLSLVSCFGR
jgi:hypothetical protein